MAEQVAVFRRPAYVWLPLTGAIVAHAFAFVLMGPVDEPAGALMLGGLALFFWALGWDSAVRSTADRVSVTNFLVTSTVAWGDVLHVAANGCLHVALRDGRSLTSVGFGSSLVGTFTGYPTHRRAVQLLEETHRAAPETRQVRGPAQIDTRFEWRRLLGALATVYGPLLIVWALPL